MKNLKNEGKLKKIDSKLHLAKRSSKVSDQIFNIFNA
jgi:hypothetical protein